MVKNTLLIILSVVFFQLNGFSQEMKEHEVPKIVRDGVKKKYPQVYIYEWEWKKKRNVYQVEFIIKGYEYEADFTTEGVWVKTERDLSRNDIPAAVWESFNKTQYASWKIDDLEEHNTPKYKSVFAFEVKSNKTKVLLYFLPSGELVETFFD